MKTWNWGNSNRRNELPANWRQIRRWVRERAGGTCEAMSQITKDRRIHGEGIRCWRQGTDADHIGDRHDHHPDNLQWLCPEHHREKTLRESAEARRRLGPVKRPAEGHPGRLR